MKINHSFTKYLLSTLTIFNSLLIWYNYPENLLAETINNSQKCSNNVEDLANSLVKDIPDYANRIIQRSRIHSHPLEFFPIYVITASKPDLETLPLTQTQYKNLIKPTLNDNIKQVFFTTLERQYSTNNRIIETQNFHWLILTQTSKDWQVVTVLSKLGYPNNSPHQSFITSPPLDTTQGIIGQAITLWLKDC
jgi:hypothetical protein